MEIIGCLEASQGEYNPFPIILRLVVNFNITRPYL